MTPDEFANALAKLVAEAQQGGLSDDTIEIELETAMTLLRGE